MKHYLLDTSVIIEFYRANEKYDTPAKIRHSRQICAALAAQRLTGKAVLFVPSFCIAEVKNTLTKWFYRKKIITSKSCLNQCLRYFNRHVADRTFFYTYDLNEYHNLNFEAIVSVEHTVNTEFVTADLPVGTDEDRVRQRLRAQRRNDNLGRYYLSTLDILIISMGMELKRVVGGEVYLLTNDKRLALISGRNDLFPRPLLWNRLSVSELERLP
jgi:hypothetical protein